MPMPSDRVAMARGLALLFAVGSALVTLTLVLPHRAGEADVLLALPAGLACPVAALLLARPDRWSPRALGAFLAFGCALVGLCVAIGGQTGSVYAFMYVWAALYAAAFFTPAVAVAHVSWAVATYAVVLVVAGEPRPPGAQLLMAAGTSAVVAGFILTLSRTLRARTRDLLAVTALANEIVSAGEVSADDVARRICERVMSFTGASGAVLLEGAPDGRLSALGRAGAPRAVEVDPALLRSAFSDDRQVRAADRSGVHGLVAPVRRQGVPAGLLVVGWDPPRRRLGTRAGESLALFAAEAAVALERVARQVRDGERRAMELNDEIVQGLVVAKYALEHGHAEAGVEAVDRALERVRALVDAQLGALHGERTPEPGEFRIQGPEAVAPR